MPHTVPSIMIDGRVLLGPPGGVFEYARRLIPALREARGLSYETWANAARAKTAHGVDTFTRLPNKFLNGMIALTGFPALDRFARRTPAAVWMPNLHFAAFSKGLPLALTIHDLTFETYPEFFPLKRRFWRLVVHPRNLAERADVLLALSETTKADLVERWRIPPERVTVTLAGVGSEFFNPLPEVELRRIQERHRLPQRFILHVGAIEPRKNHLGLLLAYHQIRGRAAHRDVGLVLAGPAGWRNAAVFEAIRRSPYRDDIRVLGYVSDEDRRGLYRLASLLAFPSFYEGFGLPPLEAMASGLPVVAAHAGALGEIVSDAGLLTDPYRPAEIAAALDAVLDSPSLAGLYRERGLARASLFSWKTCAQKTEAALRAIMK